MKAWNVQNIGFYKTLLWKHETKQNKVMVQKKFKFDLE
jgi:hypothetical protein